MVSFWQSLLFVAAAEMGDKSQLVALAFASRYAVGTVLWGIFVATALVHLFSVAVGELLGLSLPRFWISLVAGLAFLGFGLWTLRGDDLDGDETKPARFGPFLTVTATFFLAELGDKTMLLTVTMASQLREFVPVWLGSTLGMVVADAVAVVVGVAAGKRLPERAIKYGAAALFIASGVWTLADAFRG